MPDLGDIMMYISKASYKRKTFYKVLYIDTVYYIRSDAFKDDTPIKTRKINSNKKNRV
jgi:hypothetical protein